MKRYIVLPILILAILSMSSCYKKQEWVIIGIEDSKTVENADSDSLAKKHNPQVEQHDKSE